jgi:hypothetical protein
MRSDLTEVLAREASVLASATTRAGLACWRDHVVRELMASDSPYVGITRCIGDIEDRAEFNRLWCHLIIAALDQMLDNRDGTCAEYDHRLLTPIDSAKTATLILAALHGGGRLSQLSRDPAELNVALDLALAPLQLPPARAPQ